MAKKSLTVCPQCDVEWSELEIKNQKCETCSYPQKVSLIIDETFDDDFDDDYFDDDDLNS